MIEGRESAAVSARAAAAARACGTALELAAGRSFASHDPFDLLLAPGGELLRKRSRFAARVAVQLGLHSGNRLRRVLRIRAHEEAKAVADLLAAASILSGHAAVPWARDHVSALVARLERLAVVTPNGRGWGLSFPYASRFVSVPALTPNAYTTISAVAALLEAVRVGRNERALALARDGAAFVVRDLGTVGDGWIRYWPDDDSRIVNLQALAAAAFVALAERTGDPALAAIAETASRAARSAQRPDGSFPYALEAHGQFVDAFHTGFVLEGLARAHGIDDSVRRGFEYLRAHLIDKDGFPRRSPGGPRVADGQNLGQLIQTLLVCGDEGDRARAWTVWDEWAARPPHEGSLRWDVAPMALASARLARAAGSA